MMETIYLIIIFIVPGLMHKAMKQALTVEAKKADEGTEYERLFYVVANSIIITTLSFTGMYLLKLESVFPQNLDEIIKSMKEFTFLKKYAATMIVMTVIWYIITEKLLKPCWHKVRNWYFLKRFNVEFSSAKPLTTWEEIILSQESNGRKPLIAVYDGKALITAGFLDMYNQGDFSETEFSLARTKKVMRLMNEDEKKTDKEKLFKKVVQEFYDIESGKRIVFFDSEAIYKHWDD